MQPACCLLLLLAMLLACFDLHDGLALAANTQEQRKGHTENLFNNRSYLEELAVTCENGQPSPTDLYPAHTWTCHNMRINGLRLMHVFPAGFSGGGCGDDLGNRYSNQVHELCAAMLKLHSVDHKLWTAMVQDATCKDTESYPRMMFVKRPGGFRWKQVLPGKGYAQSLRCMTEME